MLSAEAPLNSSIVDTVNSTDPLRLNTLIPRKVLPASSRGPSEQPTYSTGTASPEDNGRPVRFKPSPTSVSLKRIGDSIEETDKRDGKVISVSKMTVAKDGKNMVIDVDDKLNGTTATYVAVKQ